MIEIADRRSPPVALAIAPGEQRRQHDHRHDDQQHQRGRDTGSGRAAARAMSPAGSSTTQSQPPQQGERQARPGAGSAVAASRWEIGSVAHASTAYRLRAAPPTLDILSYARTATWLLWCMMARSKRMDTARSAGQRSTGRDTAAIAACELDGPLEARCARRQRAATTRSRRARSRSASSSGARREFFDFFVYAIASVLVFPSLVFPFVDPADRARSIRSRCSRWRSSRGRSASLIFMWIDRSYGRGVKLTIALFLLGGSTDGDRVPARLRRGRHLVGDRCSRCSASARASRWAAPGTGSPRCWRSTRREKQRGWYAMIPQLGAPLGLLVASGAVRLLRLDAVERAISSPGAGAIRSSSPSRSTSWRCSRGCASSSTPEFERLFESRELQPAPCRRDGRRRSGATIVARRLRAARQLRAVPPGHGVPAVLGRALHAARTPRASW